LAHHIAHLIVNGADPARILLLTFLRRAAVEMETRAQRIVAAALGAMHGSANMALPWAGTFHAIGARILPQYAAAIGLEPNFTIHDREDSADLMNLVRHELKLVSRRQCQRTVGARRAPAGCAEWETECPKADAVVRSRAALGGAATTETLGISAGFKPT
jgi:superfamily I DNA/RNA helicase